LTKIPVDVAIVFDKKPFSKLKRKCSVEQKLSVKLNLIKTLEKSNK